MTKITDLRALTVVAAAVVAGLLVTVVMMLVGARQAEAAFPGANGRIAFSANGGIWTVNPDGSDQVNLTPGPTGGGEPAWSSDGTEMAFVKRVDIPASSNEELFKMHADGSGVVRLTNNEKWESGPAWSPDGTKLVFSRLHVGRARDGDWDVWMMNADGSGETALTSTSGDEFDPVWSPDGTKIAFSRSHQLYVMNADGTGQRPISDSGGFGRMPDWSPHGTKIVYMRNTHEGDASYEIFVMNADGTGDTRLTQNNVDDLWPSFSPDGRYIVFQSCTNDRCFIKTMRTDGTLQTDVTSPKAGTFQDAPDWQPLVPLFVWPSNALTIDWRDVLTLPGRLFFGPGNPMPGQRVYLEERPAGSEKFTLTPGAEATTTEDGSFSFEKVGPSENTDYRVRFEGNEAKGMPPATSLTKRVNVRVLVSERLSTTSLKLGESLSISGAVTPEHEGKGTLIIRRNGKAWAEKSADLTGSRYSFRYKPGAVGEYTVVARYPTHADHLGNTSRKRSFVVVR